MNATTSVKEVRRKIHLIRGYRVMLDSDLAALYEVEPRALNQAVRRNEERFPADFMFQLTAMEHEALRSQTVILKTGSGRHRKYLPLVFTEQGVAMLSSVLRGDRAAQVNIAIMRTFVKMREHLESDRDLAKKIDQIERKLGHHDGQFKEVFRVLRQLILAGVPTTQKRIKGLARG
jgi:hypothetical protein